MTRNQMILAFVANGGTYNEAAAQNVTRIAVAGVCRRAGLKVGTCYPDRNRDNGRRHMEYLRARARGDPVLRATWIAATKDGHARASRREERTAP